MKKLLFTLLFGVALVACGDEEFDSSQLSASEDYGVFSDAGNIADNTVGAVGNAFSSIW